MTTSSTPFASASLYVGDLAAEVTEALLFERFNAVGPVASVRVCRDAATRRSLGYAYVNYHRVDDAERALDTLNFVNIRNKPCRIMWSQRDPTLRKSGVGNIFVKNLAKTIDNKSLYDTFSMFGNILSCKVAMNRKGESLGYGFVHYESKEASDDAIMRVDGKVIAGLKVSVSAFKTKKERGENKFRFTNVYAKNIPVEWGTQKFEELFEKYGGKITSSKLVKDEEGNYRGFGFCNYELPEQAQQAIDNLHGYEVGPDKKLYVARAQKRAERQKELRQRFEKMKLDRQRKFVGVNLYVKNLGDAYDDFRLRKEFQKFGTLTSSKVMLDSQGTSRGFGFVCFTNPQDATKAMTEMNGRMSDGKPLYVALAQRKEVRQAQLEAQYAQRAKMGVQQQIPPHAAAANAVGAPAVGAPPMYFQGRLGYPQARYPYPSQSMMPGYPPRMMGYPTYPTTYPGYGYPGYPPQLNYQLMPAAARVTPRQRRQMRPTVMNLPKPQSMHMPPVGRGFTYSERVRYPGPQPHQPQRQPRPQHSIQHQQPGGSHGLSQGHLQGGDREPLTIETLASAPEEQKKQMIGEHLFPLIKDKEPELAGKITGMLLEMDNAELVNLLDSQIALGDKIQEALHVLKEHEQQTGHGTGHHNHPFPGQ